MDPEEESDAEAMKEDKIEVKLLVKLGPNGEFLGARPISVPSYVSLLWYYDKDTPDA